MLTILYGILFLILSGWHGCVLLKMILGQPVECWGLHVLGALVNLFSGSCLIIIALEERAKRRKEFFMELMMLLRESPVPLYGVPIRQEMEERLERFVSAGEIYVALERLEEKGIVRSQVEEGGTERGGRAKKYFYIARWEEVENGTRTG
jgi:hypothetical protein